MNRDIKIAFFDSVFNGSRNNAQQRQDIKQAGPADSHQ
jgi:hypothetical protein